MTNQILLWELVCWFFIIWIAVQFKPFEVQNMNHRQGCSILMFVICLSTLPERKIGWIFPIQVKITTFFIIYADIRARLILLKHSYVLTSMARKMYKTKLYSDLHLKQQYYIDSDSIKIYQSGPLYLSLISIKNMFQSFRLEDEENQCLNHLKSSSKLKNKTFKPVVFICQLLKYFYQSSSIIIKQHKINTESMNSSFNHRSSKSPSNYSALDDQYYSPFLRLQIKPRNNCYQQDSIFANKESLKKSKNYIFHQKKHSRRNTTQFSNTIIKSKVQQQTQIRKQAVDVKFSARTQFNPECEAIFKKTSKMLPRRGTSFTTTNKTTSNYFDSSKPLQKTMRNQFRLLLKQSQKYLKQNQTRNLNSAKTQRNHNQSTFNHSNLTKSKSAVKSVRKRGIVYIPKSSFNFEPFSLVKPDGKPIALTFGKYKTILQRSQSKGKTKNGKLFDF